MDLILQQMASQETTQNTEHKGFVSTNIMLEYQQRHYKGIEVKGAAQKSSQTTLETRLPINNIPNKRTKEPFMLFLENAFTRQVYVLSE